MPPLNSQQREEFLQHLIDSKYSPDEAMMMLHEAEGEGGSGLTMDKPLAEQALKMLPVAGAIVGGAAVPALAEKFLPQAALRYIPRPVLSGAGQAAGAYLGGASPPEAATIGALGGGVESAANVGARLVGATTSVPSETISRTLAKPTIAGAKTMFMRPGEMAERTIGAGLLRRLGEARANISPGRLTKVAIRDAADRAGVLVPLDDLHKTIDAGITESNIAVGKADVMASARLSMLKRDLARKFPGGTITPKQADAQLQAFQRDAEMATARNNPFLASTYHKLKNSLRDSFFKAVDTAVPGSDIAKATGEARKYLKSIDTLEQFVQDKTPETFVRSLFRNEDPAQSALQALRDFEKQTGTGGRLESEIHDLALKRDWTAGEQGRAFSLWRAVEKIIAKPLTKGLIVAARPAGQTAAATTAFTQALNPQANP